MRDKPLAGIRIIDLTRLLPGPLATLFLADMGADVIKVEDTGAGDYTRWNEPRQGKHSPFFLAINRNKRSIKLDLRQDAGVKAYMDLARTADVVIEQFRPGVVDRLGVGYEATRRENPKIVYCSISGYGQDGPYRDRAGHDINYLSYAGMADQFGRAGDPPALLNFQIADIAGGTLPAVIGVLAAVVDAQKSGEGRYVDVSMTDCSLAIAIAELGTYLALGRSLPRGRDVLSGGQPCYNIYETKDGRYVSLGALEPKFWEAFVQAVGRPDLSGKGNTMGKEGDAVKAEVEAIFKEKTLAEWEPILEEADCCGAPILTLEEAMENPQIKARNMVVEVDNPEDGRMTQFAFPIKFSDFEFTVDRAAPQHGEHSEEILKEAGYAADDIAELREKGVI